jgi:uncharacterized protein YndB with AHSA1/START domain
MRTLSLPARSQAPGPVRAPTADPGSAIIDLPDKEEAMAREYVFVDEWDVRAPIEEVFEALADARTYPAWWKPVYAQVEADGPPEVGRISHQRFQGRLPYTLKTRSAVVRLQRPCEIEVHVDGDLSGRGIWTLTRKERGVVHVRFDWRVSAGRPHLRYLSPVLRPAFRWNHDWAIARAMEGLEPFAQGLARSQAASPAVT